MAAGRLAEGAGDWLGAAGGADVVRLRDASVDAAADVLDGRQIVVVARDAHRYEWERDAIETLLARATDAIVVETGLPRWRPSGASAYIATYGAARVNVEAAAERLYSGPRRGVEQSGSSPGS